jgi:glycosyltransferase involved in cell wall biosynthesis
MKMIKVAIDISPLESSHQFRGIGSYTKRLVAALEKVDEKNKYILINQQSAVINQQFDLIHYPYFDLFWLTLPFKKPKPTVVTVHDLIPLVFPDKFPKGIKGWLKYQIQRQSLRRAEAIITDSENSKRDIMKFIGFPQEKIYVVYLAAAEAFKPIKSTARLEQIKKKYYLPPSFVLYVGDVNYNKNILGLVKACKKIKIPLVIVGKEAVQEDFDQFHAENQPLVQLIELYGKDNDVLRLGFVSEEDLTAIYNLAMVYCQPSFYEGFGLPVLEAMACGTPVVAAKTASLPEICGEAALMVDPKKTDEISLGIKRIIDDKMLRERLVKRGLTQVKKFSWEKTARETIKVYERIGQSKN